MDDKQKHVRLSKFADGVVMRLSESYKISFAAALEIIIREWDRTSEKVTTTGGNGANNGQ